MSQLVQFIKDNFIGATITVTLVFGGEVTGEVIDGTDNILALRLANGSRVFINAQYIVKFF